MGTIIDIPRTVVRNKKKNNVWNLVPSTEHTLNKWWFIVMCTQVPTPSPRSLCPACSKYVSLVSPARQQALEGHGKGFPSTSHSTLAQSWAKENAK